MRTRPVWLAVAMAACAAGAGLQPARAADAVDRFLRDAANPPVVLTPARPRFEGTAEIIAPGTGLQGYTVVHIDTEAFTHGGTLLIAIEISPGSETDGSFNLFPAEVPIPRQGRPDGAVAGRYDIQRGTRTRLEHRFDAGASFNFGASGNWFSHKGNRGEVRFTAWVE